MNKARSFCFSAVLAICITVSLAAQTSDFTYQGNLRDAGVPASGSYDLQFAVFDSISGGTQVTSTITRAAIAVSAGVFTVRLDFGPAAFTGADRFLEISVRPAGGGTYSVLSPRQQITSSPYSVKGLKAASSDSLSASCVLCVTNAHIANSAVTSPKIASGQVVKSVNSITDNVTLAGGSNVTITPAGSTLTIASTGVGGSGTANRIPLWATGTTVGDSVITQSAAGNVGIGTTADPVDKLQIVSGTADIRLGSPNADGIEVQSSLVGHSPALTLTSTAFGGRKFRIASYADGVNDGSFVIRDDTKGQERDRLRIDSAGRLFNSLDSFFEASFAFEAFAGTGYTRYAGMSTEDLNRLINFGINTGRQGVFDSNRPGYWLRADTRPGAEGFGFFKKEASTGSESSLMTVTDSGNVGIGIDNPIFKLEVITSLNSGLRVQNNTPGGLVASFGGLGVFRVDAPFIPGGRFYIGENGNIGIGTTAADQRLTVNGNASKVGGGSWAVFSDARLKNVSGRYTRGIADLMRLSPIRFEYKADNALGLRGEGEYIGFSAQEVESVLPEAVSRSTGGYLQLNNDPILWTMLNSIKEQQTQIERQNKLIEGQQQQIDILKKLLCSTRTVEKICLKP